MRIVILDGGAANPGDLSWAPLEALGDLTVYEKTAPEEVIPRAAGAEALIVNRAAVTGEALRQLPGLRFLGTLGTGYNMIDLPAAREQGVTVCNVPSYCQRTVAQQALSLLLCLCGNVHRYSELVRAGQWDQAAALNTGAFPLVELSGRTLGVVGYGSIGRHMTELALALGMEVLLYSRTQREAPAGCRWVDLDTLFSQSDAVSLHCPLTQETHHLVGRELLSRMKPTAFLINTSRGGVVDSAALAEALNTGKLAGAGLDVLEQEPPKRDDPLLTARNCVITPHVAWASKEARERLIADVAENLRRFQEGCPQNVVN